MCIRDSPYTRQLSSHATPLEHELTQTNRFYPLPSELKQDDFLATLFTPRNGIRELCDYLIELIKNISTIYRKEGEYNDIFNQLYRESLFQSHTKINRLYSLIESGELNIRTDTLKRLITKVLTSSNIPLDVYKRQILNSLNNHIDHFPIRVKTLATNRRSETNVIRFNNQIFTAAANYLNGVYKQQLGKDCEDLQKAYADVVQESPRSTEKGYVKVSFLEPDEEHGYTEQTLISLGEEVQHLLTSGVRLNDIAILVRKNKSIPRIADYFDKELHYKVVSDEAFRLDASLAI